MKSIIGILLIVSLLIFSGCSEDYDFENKEIAEKAFKEDLNKTLQSFATKEEVNDRISKKDLDKSLQNFITKEEVIDLLNSCNSIESDSSDSSITCDDVCKSYEKTCIKADIASYNTNINAWIFDTGAECKTSYGSTRNEATNNGLKLQCLCCNP